MIKKLRKHREVFQSSDGEEFGTLYAAQLDEVDRILGRRFSSADCRRVLESLPALVEAVKLEGPDTHTIVNNNQGSK